MKKHKIKIILKFKIHNKKLINHLITLPNLLITLYKIIQLIMIFKINNRFSNKILRFNKTIKYLIYMM